MATLVNLTFTGYTSCGASPKHVVSLLNQHREGGSLVMVTHDRSMLEEADRIIHLSDGGLTT